MYFVYILASNNNRVVYTGVTNDLIRRVHEHKIGAVEGFTKKYHVHKLVYFDVTSDVKEAIAREKQIKGWMREKKNALISEKNPTWRDLFSELVQ